MIIRFKRATLVMVVVELQRERQLTWFGEKSLTILWHFLLANRGLRHFDVVLQPKVWLK